MALIGTEQSIRCQECNGIEFTESVIVKFHEGLTNEKYSQLLKIGRRPPLKSERYEYVCKSCGIKLG